MQNAQERKLFQLKSTNNFNTFSEITEKYFNYIYLSLVLLILIFGRSFTGIIFFGLRLGELLTAGSLVLLSTVLIFKKKNINKLIGNKAYFVLVFIVVYFPINLIITENMNNIFNTSIYKASSYIWTLGFLFIPFFMNRINFQDSIFFRRAIFLSLPITYILTTVHFPEPLKIFFINYSDKFQFLKGSDLFLVFAIFCLIWFRRIENDNNLIFWIFLMVGLQLPLLFYSSRGASIAGTLLFIFFILKYRKLLISKWQITLLSLVTMIIFLIISSIYLDWRKIDIQEINSSVAIESIERTLISRRYPQTEKPIFYFEYGRINSGDPNLNWRLQIWQDVYQDLSESQQLLSGHGFVGVIPAMDESSRAGLDGTNQNVHNYFVNILARGGLVHLTSFIILISLLFVKISTLPNKSEVFLFTATCLFVSFFDSSMETVRFPLIFYLIISNNLYKSNH